MVWSIANFLFYKSKVRFGDLAQHFYRAVSGRRKKKKFRPLSGQSVWEKKERAREKEAEEVTEISPNFSSLI